VFSINPVKCRNGKRHNSVGTKPDKGTKDISIMERGIIPFVLKRKDA
jgi:hypothetical protein